MTCCVLRPLRSMAPKLTRFFVCSCPAALDSWRCARASWSPAQIKVTKAVDGCTRKAADGDAISVHYGTWVALPLRWCCGRLCTAAGGAVRAVSALHRAV